MAGRAQNPRRWSDRARIKPLPTWSTRPLWEGLAIAIVAVCAAVYGAVISGRERAAQAPLEGMLEGLELLAIERDVSIPAHDIIAELTMAMYEGGHEAGIDAGMAALRTVMEEAAARLAGLPPSDGWRLIHAQMMAATSEALEVFEEPRTTSETLAWIDEYLYNFKRVIPTDNLGEWTALLEVATWVQETPLVVRDYMDGAMAREWALEQRAPADSALLDSYRYLLATWRRLKESHGDAAHAYSLFEEYLEPERATEADSVSERLFERLAQHPAIGRIDRETPFLMGLTTAHEFESIEEIYRLRRGWMAELVVRTEALRQHAIARIDRALDVSERRQLTALAGAALAMLLALTFAVRLIRGRLRVDTEIRSALEQDVLTGLANRYALFSAAPGRLADPGWGSFALIHLDLDDFKSINDEHGHHVGDGALVAFADAMRAAVRSSADFVCRIGGDEFVILLHRLRDPEKEVEAVVDRLRERLEYPVTLEGISIDLHFTAGVAVANEPTELEELLVEADLALLDAKERGRDIARFFRRKLGRRMIHELSTALGNGDLRCSFQPQFDMENGRVVGLEALARWRREDRLEVPARSLIDALEWLGASRDWLRVAMQDIEAAWVVSRDWFEGRIWLNLMGCDLDELPADHLLEILAGTRVPLDRLGVEITDAVARGRFVDVAGRLQALRDEGIQVALDDVGHDRVPLLHVTELPIDLVKLDRCLITGLDSQPPLRAVVESLADLCQRLGLDALAEGVETVEEEAALRTLGIRLVQGFLFARPVRVADLEDFPARQNRSQNTGSVA